MRVHVERTTSDVSSQPAVDEAFLSYVGVFYVLYPPQAFHPLQRIADNWAAGPGILHFESPDTHCVGAYRWRWGVQEKQCAEIVVEQVLSALQCGSVQAQVRKFMPTLFISVRSWFEEKPYFSSSRRVTRQGCVRREIRMRVSWVWERTLMPTLFIAS